MKREDLREGMAVAVGNKKLLFTHRALKGIILCVSGWTVYGSRRLIRQKPSGKLIAIAQKDSNDVWVPKVIHPDRILMPWEEYEKHVSSTTPCLPPRPNTYYDFSSLAITLFETFGISEKDGKIVRVTNEDPKVLLNGHAIAKILRLDNFIIL